MTSVQHLDLPQSSSAPRKQKVKNPKNKYDIFDKSPEVVEDDVRRNWLDRTHGCLRLIFLLSLFIFILLTALISRFSFHLLLINLNPPTIFTALNKFGGDTTNITASFVPAEVHISWVWACFLVLLAPSLHSFAYHFLQVCKRSDVMEIKIKCNDENAKLKNSIGFYIPNDEKVEEYFKEKIDIRIQAAVIIGIGAVQAIGETLAVFLLLPTFDQASAGIIATNMTLLVPTVLNGYLNPYFRCHKKLKQKPWKIIGFKILMGFITSCSFVFLIAYASLLTEKNDVNSPLGIIILTIIIFSISSIGFWENVSGFNFERLRDRKIIMMGLSVSKVVTNFITLLVAFRVMSEHDGIEVLFGTRTNATVTFLDKNIRLVSTVNFREHCYTEHPFYVAIVSLFASYLCFKASYQACRTYLQWPSFSIPLILNLVLVPILLGFYLKPYAFATVGKCSIISNDWDFNANGDVASQSMIVLCGVSTFFSVLLLTTYVWRNGMRIKKLEKIFAMPFYAGYAVDITLLWSRRRLRKSGHVHPDINKAKTKPIPVIYLCATMWHETELEMKTLLRSIFRLNRHQFMMVVKQLFLLEKGIRKEPNEQFYQFEAHIFFDDAFKENREKVKPKDRINSKEKSKLCPGGETNEYVTQFIKCIEDTARSFYRIEEFPTSRKYKTPYGGRLEWDLLVPNFDDLKSSVRESLRNKSSAGGSSSESKNNESSPRGNSSENKNDKSSSECSSENKSNESSSRAGSSDKNSSETSSENLANIWTVPCKLVLHLKDKALIRNKKRWSQVMYMYFLLSYNSISKKLGRKGALPESSEKSTSSTKASGSEKMREEENDTLEEKRKRFANVIAPNTFILALDGDVDFKPSAVLRLLERMQKNNDVGAACGRIIPMGGGPVVWYQKFEYAASHWLQKSTEHVFGCVLCSPGCFSLFRASALMSTDIIKIYTSIPSTAVEYVQFDQGEDRWLSTLLLKQGYKLEYTAASDANTFVPEGFFEFFNQRRRWSPSTLANIFDIISSISSVTTENGYVSKLYLVYHMFLFASSIITPGTIFLMILGATVLAFPVIPLWVAFIINITLIGIFMLSCVFAEEKTQLTIASVISAIYALMMVVVLFGLIIDAINSEFCSVTSYFFCYVAGAFLLAAIMHPMEFHNIFYGIVYFLAVPTTSMLLLIYALGNLHVTSWGTRESNKPGKRSKQKPEDPEETTCSCFGLCRYVYIEIHRFWNEIIDKYLSPNIQEDTKKQENLLNLRNSVYAGFIMINIIYITIVFVITQANELNNDVFTVRLPCPNRTGSFDVDPISIVFCISFGLVLFFQLIGMIIHRFSTFTHIVAVSKITGKSFIDREKKERKKRWDLAISRMLNETNGDIMVKSMTERRKAELNTSVRIIKGTTDDKKGINFLGLLNSSKMDASNASHESTEVGTKVVENDNLLESNSSSSSGYSGCSRVPSLEDLQQDDFVSVKTFEKEGIDEPNILRSIVQAEGKKSLFYLS
ncbi:chitin synthase chs-2-like [Saccostrea echinata]|uniref:chitin synthase chs-2-like n=1 Tax=Saccostrea echinata TaxID=191078 RepID=UPI002A805C60|nr:chitin synthase chs-2-like [Saccostrea echinata]